MNELTIPYEDYGQSTTYFGVAYTLTPEDNDRLRSIDPMIQDKLKDIIYFAPSGSRHITIVNITSVVDDYKDPGVMQFFEKNIGLYRDRLKTIASTIRPFEVTFTQLQVSANAIILRGQDHGQISEIRDKLMDLPRLDGRVPDAGFIHSTQARFKKSVPINEICQQLEDIEVTVPIKVDTIRLVRADYGFSKPHVILGEFELGTS